MAEFKRVDVFRSEEQFFNQEFYTFGGALKDTLDRRATTNGQSRDNYNFQIDYILPFNSTQKLEAGYRGSLQKNAESQISDLQTNLRGISLIMALR